MHHEHMSAYWKSKLKTALPITSKATLLYMASILTSEPLLA